MRIYLPSIVTAAIAASVAISSPSLASDTPITVLGITLGSPIGKYPSVCPIKSIADDNYPNTCWIEKPNKAKDGSSQGSIQFPGSATRPRWARVSTYEASIDNQRVITDIKARVSSSDYKDEIVTAIKQRFGPQTEPFVTTPRLFAATWRKSDIYIHLLCAPGEYCSVEFMLPSKRAELDAELEARRKRDAQNSGI